METESIPIAASIMGRSLRWNRNFIIDEPLIGIFADHESTAGDGFEREHAIETQARKPDSAEFILKDEMPLERIILEENRGKLGPLEKTAINVLNDNAAHRTFLQNTALGYGRITAYWLPIGHYRVSTLKYSVAYELLSYHTNGPFEYHQTPRQASQLQAKPYVLLDSLPKSYTSALKQYHLKVHSKTIQYASNDNIAEFSAQPSTTVHAVSSSAPVPYAINLAAGNQKIKLKEDTNFRFQSRGYATNHNPLLAQSFFPYQLPTTHIFNLPELTIENHRTDFLMKNVPLHMSFQAAYTNPMHLRRTGYRANGFNPSPGTVFLTTHLPRAGRNHAYESSSFNVSIKNYKVQKVNKNYLPQDKHDQSHRVVKATQYDSWLQGREAKSFWQHFFGQDRISVFDCERREAESGSKQEHNKPANDHRSRRVYEEPATLGRKRTDIVRELPKKYSPGKDEKYQKSDNEGKAAYSSPVKQYVDKTENKEKAAKEDSTIKEEVAQKQITPKTLDTLIFSPKEKEIEKARSLNAIIDQAQSSFDAETVQGIESFLEHAKNLGYKNVAFFAYNEATGEKYGHRANKVISTPSINKLALAFAVMYYLQEGLLDASKPIAIKKRLVLEREIGNYKVFGDEKKSISYQELIKLVVEESVNSASNHLLELLGGEGGYEKGIERFNHAMKQFGFSTIEINSLYLRGHAYHKNHASMEHLAKFKHFMMNGNTLKEEYFQQLKNHLQNECWTSAYRKGKALKEYDAVMKPTVTEKGMGFVGHAGGIYFSVMLDDSDKKLYSEPADKKDMHNKMEPAGIATVNAFPMLFATLGPLMAKNKHRAVNENAALSVAVQYAA